MNGGMISYDFLKNTGNLWSAGVDFLLDVVTWVMGVILTPLSVLLNTLLGSNTTAVNYTIDYAIGLMTNFASFVAYPMTILPSTFKVFIIWIIDFEVAWCIGQVSYYTFMLLFRWIKQLKFW